MYLKCFCQISTGLNERWRNDSYFKIGSFWHFLYSPEKRSRHSDVIVDLIRILFYRKLFILSQSSSVQNLSSLTLKTKELWKGGGKHPQCYNETKKPSAYRVKLKN